MAKTKIYRHIYVNEWNLIVERNYQSIKIPFVRESYARAGMTRFENYCHALSVSVSDI